MGIQMVTSIQTVTGNRNFVNLVIPINPRYPGTIHTNIDKNQFRKFQDMLKSKDPSASNLRLALRLPKNIYL